MFVNYKNRGFIFLEKDYSEHLLEQLENAQAILANMLTSKYVGPLREEAAGWAEKLRGKDIRRNCHKEIYEQAGY